MQLLTILLSGGMEFLGTPIFDAKDFWNLITKTIFNLTQVELEEEIKKES